MDDLIEKIELDDGTIVKIFRDSTAQTPPEYTDMLGDVYIGGQIYDGMKDALDMDVDLLAAIASGKALVIPFMYLGGRQECLLWQDAVNNKTDGIIVSTNEKLCHEYGVDELNKETLEVARRVLIGELEMFNQWMSGDIFGYVRLYKNGKIKDSCWGYYGTNFTENGLYDASGVTKHAKNHINVKKCPF